MNQSFIKDLSLNNIDNENWTIFVQAILIAPEYVNCLFLLLGIYGMYHGIEIQHPLYATIFLNLVVAFFFTLLDIIAFLFISTETFISISNASSGFTLYFHCTNWCVSSVIRYVYIVHEIWINNVMPSHQSQCLLASCFSFVFCLTLSGPTFGYAIYIGTIFTLNIAFFCKMQIP